MHNALFYIKDAKVSGEKLILSGDYIVADTLEVDAPGGKTSSSGPVPKPTVKIPGPLKVKWILPPTTSKFYGNVKAAAEDAGYETVEHDDFSYPEPRG